MENRKNINYLGDTFGYTNFKKIRVDLMEAYYSKLPINRLLFLILNTKANGTFEKNTNYNLLLIHIKKRKPNNDQLNLLDLILKEDSKKILLHFELFEQKIKKVNPW